MSRDMDRSRKEAEFALAALMEIPSQYQATKEFNILGASRGMKIDRIPLPPPQYGAPPPSTSHYPSVEHISHSSYYDDNHLCPICIAEPKDMAFGCGHQTCCDCGRDLQCCPICRKPIDTRIKLY